jgi:YVTN family beta-propeller protein
VVKVFRTSDFEQVATIETGALPHGLWPSGDGTRIYVGLENADAAAAIDTQENKVIATIPVGQAPQGVAYVPTAVPSGEGLNNLQPRSRPSLDCHLRAESPRHKSPCSTKVWCRFSRRR